MREPRIIICPDADRFPMGAAEHDLAAAANLRLVEIHGHGVADFRYHGQDALGCLAWGGAYGPAVMDALPRLRVLARCGTGIDNIDLEAARARGVVVTKVPGASVEEVSDHTIALILACFRMLVSSDAAVRRGEWPSAVQLSSMRRVRGTCLGLVGFGHIASAVATKALGLGMEVAAYDPFVPVQYLHERGVGQASTLEDLLEQADVISLHVPPSSDGSPILGPAEFGVMRRGALIINTGRGSLVDETCLHEALSTGYLSAAGLDVFQTEPLPSGSPLIDLNNVVLTPHSAAFSEQALSEIRQSALADVVAVLNGHAPVHPVES